MEMTNKLKQRFVKDYSLPIGIFTEPYFSYLLELYEPLLQTKTKWKLYAFEVGCFDSEQVYFELYNSIKDQAINYIKMKPEFQAFNTMDMNNFKVDTKNINTKGVFKDCNKNKTLLSIDLKKGNFNALKFLDKKLVGNCTNYEDFISKFTSKQHIIESKYIRQVILGACNPSRQIAVEKYMMSFFLNSLCEVISKENIIAYMNDEIVIDLEGLDEEQIRNIINLVSNQHKIEVKVEKYLLKKFENTDYFVKIFDNSFEFKGVPALFYNFVYKSYKNIPIEDNDLYFYHEGHLSKFVNIPIFYIDNRGVMW